MESEELKISADKKKTKIHCICSLSKSYKALALNLSVTEAHIYCMEVVKNINLIKWQNGKISLNLEVSSGT